MAEAPTTQLATFGGGCFWCTEAIFRETPGVASVVSGYMGGHVLNPTYQHVCGGRTGHAEVVQLKYDPQQVSYAVLLDIFFHTHDPTTLDRQGNDVGTQYRSVVFAHDAAQERAAREFIQQANENREFDGTVVTTVVPAEVFYPAENYHQNYLAENGEQPYCRVVVSPKVEKFRKRYAELLARKSAGN